MTSELTLELTSDNLPHASLLTRLQIPVSVIIRCKTVKTGAVENVRRLPALRSDEERCHRSQLADVTPWGYLTDPFA